MSKILIKYSNFIILGISLAVFCLCFDGSKISTNVLDLFPKVQERDLLDIHSSLEDSHQILISTNENIDNLKSLDEITHITPLDNDIYLLSIDKDTKMDEFYDKFKEATSSIANLRYFSTEILSIENSRAIFSDVNVIMASSIGFLVVMYLFILRIPFLSLNTLLTIISANLLGISTITTLYDNINVMSLNFGVAIGNLAIDYMLHHHFFKLYMHKFQFNKSVFYGFITTFIGFAICLFVPFPLLSQLSVYAMVCLLVSYLSFGFIYQAIGFKKPIFYRNLRKIRKPRISNKIILALSILILAITLPNLTLDYNLERLDYENKARLSDRDFFLQYLDKDSTILISSDTKEDIPTKIMQIAQVATLKSDPRNLNIIESHDKFYTKLNIAPSSINAVESFDFVDTRTIKELSDTITRGIYKPMIIVLAIVIVVMISLVIIVTRSLVSFAYIIAPLSAISVFFFFNEVNIMHLFSLLIVVVSSVDYGIYVENEGENIKTLHAIIFSALTTIAGFGFLSFSNILALKSFGLTISIGLIVILALLLLQRRSIKRSANVTNN